MGESIWLTIDQRQKWLDFLTPASHSNCDVYFLPEYNHLYGNSNSEPTCFIYQEGQNIFFYPFLLQRIPQRPGYFDISTAYGYGGPLSNSWAFEFIQTAYSKFRLDAAKKNIDRTSVVSGQ